MRPSAPLPPHDERARLAAAVAGTPRDPAPRRALAAALARAGELDAALDQYRELLALVPDDPAAAAEVGLIGCRTAREEEVLPSVRAAATAHPDHARVWQVLGLMHRALEDLEPAIEAFDRAAGLVPRDPSIAHGRARACFEAGQPSVGHYENLRRLVPGDKAVLLGLAAALIAEGRSDEAVTSLEAELERDPTWATGHAALARHLWAMGEGEAFTASFEKALHRYPRSLDLWRELIVALIHTGTFETALEAIARGRAAAGPHPLFEANEAACQAELGRYDEADALFARVAPLRDPTIMGRHIRHLLRTGRPAQAERIALSMIQTPLASEFFPYLAIAWRMTGNPLWQWLEGDPRLVGVYDLADILPSLEELAERLRALHVTLHQPLEQSLRGGTQTDGFLLLRTEPAFRALRAAFVEAVRAHVAQLPPPDPRHPQLGRPRSPIRFCGSWSVRLTSGGCHANHFHPEGWFSSAFYVSLPEPADRGPEPAGWLKLGEPQAELHLDLPPIRLIEPKPGRLVLFPSTMWHGTRPFESGERLTVAFDVAPQSGPAR